MTRRSSIAAMSVAALLLGGCSIEATRVSMDATDTASTVFKEAHDKADGKVTLEEADRILLEMERLVDLHR